MSSKSDSSPSGGFRRAVLFTSAGTIVVPLVGLVSAPILARSLGVDGRGFLAAALAPAVLVISVGTLGLPQAVTFFAARHPESSRLILCKALLLTLLSGVVVCGIVVALSGPISGDRPELSGPITIAVALALPALIVNVLRAFAGGVQRWSLTALERLLVGVGRLVALLLLFWSGHLTFVTALLVMTLTPLLGGLAYARLGKLGLSEEMQGGQSGLAKDMLSFGLRTWGGSVAGILLARLDQSLFVSVSTTEELGLYAVAVTISDVFYLLIGAVSEGLFGVTSRTADMALVSTVSRITGFVIALACAVFALSMPFWLAQLFGSGFANASLPCVVLLGAAVIQIPGVVGGVGLAASGRPGARTLSLMVALVVNLGVFYIAVPPLGAIGAALAMAAANLAMTIVVLMQMRLLHSVQPSNFVGLRRSDLTYLRQVLPKKAQS